MLNKIIRNFVLTLSITRSGVSSAASVRASTISREEDVEHWDIQMFKWSTGTFKCLNGALGHVIEHWDIQMFKQRKQILSRL